MLTVNMMVIGSSGVCQLSMEQNLQSIRSNLHNTKVRNNEIPVLLLKFPQLCVNIKRSTKIRLPLLMSILWQITVIT